MPKTLKKMLDAIQKQAHQLNKKIAKSRKNKTSLKKCADFCKNDYGVQRDKFFKKLESENKGNKFFKYNPTKKDKQYFFDVCKKTHCNEKCEGFPTFANVDKNVKNGFAKKYSKDQIDMFKKRGALSACVESDIYDVFHK